MKAYIKPIIKTAQFQVKSHLLAGSILNNTPGDGNQLAKGLPDFYPFIESTDNEEDQ